MQFKDHAVVLSGETGTKLKCEILKGYYPLWWSITSGGPNRDFRLPTSIIEMNAGTGLDYIEDTGETILGSSGHALQLKLEDERDTSKLKVVLVEEDSECFSHLKEVIKERWSSLDLEQALSEINSNDNSVYLLEKQPTAALDAIDKIPALGNALFFFDPLLYTPWSEIERVAKRRITDYYRVRTEFIVFLFTSDWFDGRRKAGLAALPITPLESKWSSEQLDTVKKVDDLFGNKGWRTELLNDNPRDSRMSQLVDAYRKRLHQWFRYVLPLPFNPKENQIYHLFMCSNYEAGVRITRDFYAKFTKNPPYSPDANEMYQKFKRAHPIMRAKYPGRERPMVWKFLRMVIRDHEEGLCDIRCQDFRDLSDDWRERLACMHWLEIFKYLKQTEKLTNSWLDVPPLYKLDWDIVVKRLGASPPPAFSPIRPQ